MPQCSAYGCFTRDGSGKKLFRIPGGRNDEERRKIWVHRIGRKNWNPTASSRLCEDHFTADQFEQHRADGVKKLKPNAIPSVFIHRPQQMPRKPPRNRKNQLGKEVPKTNEVEQDKSEQGVPDRVPETDANEETTEPLQEDHSDQDTEVGLLINRIRVLENRLKLANIQKCKAMKEAESMKQNMQKLFNEDQLTYLQRGHMRGACWSKETIQSALKLRLACGITGYKLLRDMGHPYPSERTLQENTECLKFAPGILNEILSALHVKVETMKEEEKEAAVMLDEMAISPALDYDPSLSIIFGKPTVPSSRREISSVATHALVFMVAGITTRWKQTVAYQLTGNSFCPSVIKEFMFELIRKCEEVGLKINAVISDMGGQNQALLRECGIVVGKYSKTVNFCAHPCDQGRKLYFTLDAPHILKNIRNHLTSNQEIILPAFIVDKYNLPSNIVSLECVRQLLDIMNDADLKLAPRLRESVLSPSHYEKMKVGLALALINHDTAAALNYCVKKGKLPDSSRTTAWFLKTVFHWFKLMSSREKKMALSKSIDQMYKQSVEFLNEMINLFEHIKIGKPGAWKPVQTAVILSTKTAIDLQNLFLNEKGHEYLLLSRLSQDSLENLFSSIRMKNAIPTPKAFKYALRLITMSQFFQPLRHGSYEPNDDVFLAEYVKSKEERSSQVEHQDITDTSSNSLDDENNVILSLSDDDDQALYYLCGHTVRQVKRRYKLCQACTVCLSHTEGDTKISASCLTEMKSYPTASNRNPLVCVSESAFSLLRRAEVIFRMNEEKLLSSLMTTDDILKTCLPLLKSCDIPSCHEVGMKLLKVYLTTRMFFLVRKFNGKLKQKLETKCDSRSLGMRNAIKNLK